MLQEQLSFNEWSKDAATKELQKKNVRTNIKYFTKRIQEIERQIEEEGTNNG
jgi:predicted  nucleic acid-binding Zn-ribbon protein